VRAAVYTRVSSNEQAEGYSLRQQREAVETYCKEQGWEVVEFIEDVDSGAYLERRGLDKVRDLVDLGEIDLVVAQDVDRFARDDGIIVALLKREFSRKGARLYALNQRSDGSAAGDLADKIISAVASYERSLIAQRTSRGRLQKAREGKVPNTRNFGFDCVDGRYVINSDMEAVRYIFHEAANHQSLRSIEQELAERGVKAPRGGRLWRESIRKFIFYDVYKPHTFDELSEIVSPAVLGTLNKDKSYGVLWWNCKHKEYDRDTNRRMRLVKTEVKPKSEWVAIPVPDSGIPREVVEKAKANIKDNTWKSSKRNDRFWELSGGSVSVVSAAGIWSPLQGTREISTITAETRPAPTTSTAGRRIWRRRAKRFYGI
jgi:site-specific DNA recombinase